ncbi:MAG: bifunctional 4-hydroxy-3-methylbut-2-enyl diphosphate reductase/30S ribosomal protein S1 [Eubacteriales bacterium]|nr:bifunctional 4-hydroxy-3-methylbut-2-enyl diphosphate reductase/30S ribosomal protein S1 [Eubacteriales bacterium]
MRLQIVKAEKGGFCFGVRRAVDRVFTCVGQPGRVFTYGPIIHNPDVVEALSAQGVRPVEELTQLRAGDCLVIRSHGVPKTVMDACREAGILIDDATCPYVQRIHRKVHESTAAGHPVVIVGEREHPEVIGIAGWCENAYIVSTEQDARELPPLEHPCVVAQTTTPPERFDRLVKLIEQRVTDAEIFNSICHATEERQAEAQRLAAQVDAIVVIGGKNSSNTRKLFELCRQSCPDTWWLERAQELPAQQLALHRKVAIISGASTPDWIIEEVFNKMSDIEVKSGAPENEQLEAVTEEQNSGELSFAESLEETFKSIRPGQIITGTVVQVTDDEVCVNIGYKADGIVPKSDFTAEGDVDLKATIQVGDPLEVQVKKVNDGEGNVLLSCKDIAARKNWDKLMEEYEAGTVFEGTGKSVVKGGVIASIYGVRAFVPASQLDVHYVNDLNEYVGQPMRLKIIEVEKSRHRVVASRRVVMEEEKKAKEDELWEGMKNREGEIVKGVVRRLTDFGAFVDVGGIDGLIHVTDLSWGRVRSAKDVVSVNQEVEALILKVDVERKRLSLGLKQLQPKPWEQAPDKYIVGSVVKGRVVRIVSFGAFVELEPGIDGLVHISQIANRRIEKVEDALKIGDVVDVRVLDVNPDEKRISLSIRDTLPKEETEQPELDYTPAVNENGAIYSTSEAMDVTNSIGDMVDLEQFEE